MWPMFFLYCFGAKSRLAPDFIQSRQGVEPDESGEILEEASRVVQLEKIVETQKSELDVGRRQLSVTLSK